MPETTTTTTTTPKLCACGCGEPATDGCDACERSVCRDCSSIGGGATCTDARICDHCRGRR